MSKLVKKSQNLNPEQEAQSIVYDAIAVTPNQYQQQLVESYKYLANCYIQSKQAAHLKDIQVLINAAKANDAVKIQRMQSQLQSEIAQLRNETINGFNNVANVLDKFDQRLTQLENKQVNLQHQQRIQPIIYNIQQHNHIDNSDNRSYNTTSKENNSSKSNMETFAWVIVALFFGILASVMFGGIKR